MAKLRADMTLGLLFAILTGFSWVAVGAIVGLAEKRGCGSMRQQFVSNSLIGVISLVVLGLGLVFRPNLPAFSLRCDIPSAVWMLVCGFFNYLMVVYMGRAMLRGPNGVVWTIVQSGFVFPFAMGVCLGNTPLTFANAAGVVCVLAGVVFSGRAQDGTSKAGTRSGGANASHATWLLPALAGFVLCGLNQCAACLASMGPEATRPTPLMRIILVVAGSLAGVVPQLTFLRIKNRNAPRDPDLAAKYLYLLKICGVGAVIYFVATFCFHFNALDMLEAAGRIAIANSIMLAACLVGFAIYGALALHEKISREQLFGTGFAIAGIVLVSA